MKIGFSSIFLPWPLNDPINVSLSITPPKVVEKNILGDNILPEATDWLYDELDPPTPQSSSMNNIKNLLRTYSLRKK
uniref:Uncharacterized protein n=1 Tax=Strongyloides papillosus TaxID=174720 RepID=A0A0N5BTF2_STREA